MISFIVCSANPELLKKLKENIYDTAGVDFELIIIENYHNEYNIFQAYNLGVKKSKYSILCFLHEDVLFVTREWGNLVAAHFKDQDAALIGIAGSNCLLDIPGGWWTSYKIADHYIQVMDNGEEVLKLTKITEQIREEVVCVDGAIFFIKRKLFDNISFDEKSFGGFHCYDLDISLQVRKLGYKIYVVYDILIKHCSEGKLNIPWILDSIRFQKKWSEYLPAHFMINCQEQKLNDLRSVALLDFLSYIRKNQCEKLVPYKQLKEYFNRIPFSLNSRWIRLFIYRISYSLNDLLS